LDHLSAGKVHTAYSAVSYTLPDNFDDLVLTGGSAINGTGNARNNVITGNGADNILSGGGGDDLLNGGAGNDTLIGGAGNDTYVFGLGSGQDTLDNSGGGTDRVLLGTGISAADLSFVKVGNDLQVLIAGVSDTLTVKNWFVGAAYQ